MKKILLLIAMAITYVSCQNGKLCPYTTDIVNWSNQVAQDGIKAAQIEQATQAAIKAKNYDSIAIYASQALQLATVTLQHKDSLAYYINACKDKGYSDSTKVDSTK